MNITFKTTILFLISMIIAKSNPTMPNLIKESTITPELVEKLMNIKEDPKNIRGNFAEFVSEFSKRVTKETGLQILLLQNGHTFVSCSQIYSQPAEVVLSDLVKRNEFTKNDPISYWGIIGGISNVFSGQVNLAERYIIIHCDMSPE